MGEYQAVCVRLIVLFRWRLIQLQRRSVQDIFLQASNDRSKRTQHQIKSISNAPKQQVMPIMVMANSKKSKPKNTSVLYMRNPLIIMPARSGMAQFDLTSPLFSTQPSRKITTQIAIRMTMLCSTTVLQLLPGLSLTQTVWPAVRSITCPRNM